MSETIDQPRGLRVQVLLSAWTLSRSSIIMNTVTLLYQHEHGHAPLSSWTRSRFYQHEHSHFPLSAWTLSLLSINMNFYKTVPCGSITLVLSLPSISMNTLTSLYQHEHSHFPLSAWTLSLLSISMNTLTSFYHHEHSHFSLSVWTLDYRRACTLRSRSLRSGYVSFAP